MQRHDSALKTALPEAEGAEYHILQLKSSVEGPKTEKYTLVLLHKTPRNIVSGSLGEWLRSTT